MALIRSITNSTERLRKWPLFAWKVSNKVKSKGCSSQFSTEVRFQITARDDLLFGREQMLRMKVEHAAGVGEILGKLRNGMTSQLEIDKEEELVCQVWSEEYKQWGDLGYFLEHSILAGNDVCFRTAVEVRICRAELVHLLRDDDYAHSHVAKRARCI